MAEVKWIKLATDLFDDEKVAVIEAMPKADTIITIWVKLLCLAGKQNNGGVFMVGKTAISTEMFANIFHRPVAIVRTALDVFESFGMIERENGVVVIANWDKHQSLDGMERIKEQNRLRKQKQRANSVDLSRYESRDIPVTVTQCHATDKEEDKNKDKEPLFSGYSLDSKGRPRTRGGNPFLEMLKEEDDK